jgi:hypothetical protein
MVIRLGAAVSLTLLCLLTEIANAATPCVGVDQALTSARKQEYAALVANFLRNKAKPSQIEVIGFMQEGAWSVAYASTPISDNGYFFFAEERGTRRAKDVWGGIGVPAEQPEITAWAKKLGAPNNWRGASRSTRRGNDAAAILPRFAGEDGARPRPTPLRQSRPGARA